MKNIKLDFVEDIIFPIVSLFNNVIDKLFKSTNGNNKVNYLMENLIDMLLSQFISGVISLNQAQQKIEAGA